VSLTPATENANKGPTNVYESGVTPQDVFPDSRVKQKRQIGALLALVLITAVWLWNFRGKPVVTADALLSVQDDPVLGLDSPHVRLEAIERARKTQYQSSGRNPFSPLESPPPQIPKPKPEIPGPQLPPPTPPPPPLALPSNLKFFGFGTVPNGTPRRAFFSDGGEVYVLGEGEVLLNRYRILRIGNANLEFEEISSGRTGTAPLVEERAEGKS